MFTLDPVDVPVKAAFFEQLGELLRDRGVWAVIAMREDYIAQLDAYLGVFPRRLATRMRLDFLDERARFRRLAQPGCGMGVAFTDDAADSLVADLRTVIVTRAGEPTREQGPYVEPVQLQVVCSQLWSRLPMGTTMVTKAAVEQHADTDNALAQFYADQVAMVVGDDGHLRTCDSRLVRATPRHLPGLPVADVRIPGRSQPRCPQGLGGCLPHSRRQSSRGEVVRVDPRPHDRPGARGQCGVARGTTQPAAETGRRMGRQRPTGWAPRHR